MGVKASGATSTFYLHFILCIDLVQLDQRAVSWVYYWIVSCVSHISLSSSSSSSTSSFSTSSSSSSLQISVLYLKCQSRWTSLMYRCSVLFRFYTAVVVVYVRRLSVDPPSWPGSYAVRRNGFEPVPRFDHLAGVFADVTKSRFNINIFCSLIYWYVFFSLFSSLIFMALTWSYATEFEVLPYLIHSVCKNWFYKVHNYYY